MTDTAIVIVDKKKNEIESDSYHSLLSAKLLEYRNFSLFFLLSSYFLFSADVYTRNVINEHTRELSRTTEGGGEEEKRKRAKETKDVQWKEELRGEGEYAKIYYDARGREITEEEKWGKRESRWTKG